MKALEVLKKAAVFSEHSNHYPSLSDFDEAIAELEVLESRRCSGCKYSWGPNNQIIHRYYCERIKTWMHGDFYCKYWKAKQCHVTT